MRILSVSDLHIDYPENRDWLFGLSRYDYQNDLLVLAGDLTDNRSLLEKALRFLSEIFLEVCFVPGNHDLWIRREKEITSLEKFRWILEQCETLGIHTQPLHLEGFSVIPLYAWYDYSFGQPSTFLLTAWNDFSACRWPDGMSPPEINEFFLGLNTSALASEKKQFRISFSHFLPQIDLMPDYIPKDKQLIYPVLGSEKLGVQVKTLQPDIHLYGHSHVNRVKKVGQTTYVNNAFGYPQEKVITRKDLICLYED